MAWAQRWEQCGGRLAGIVGWAEGGGVFLVVIAAAYSVYLHS